MNFDFGGKVTKNNDKEYEYNYFLVYIPIFFSTYNILFIFFSYLCINKPKPHITIVMMTDPIPERKSAAREAISSEVILLPN